MSSHVSVEEKIASPGLAPAPPSPLYGCIYIPDFPAQAFVRYEPELRRRAVAVLDGIFPLFTVAATNVFARRAGVRAGMTRLQLERFPDLVVRYRSREQEDAAHQALLDAAHYFTPRIEDTAVDRITLDLDGLSGLWGSPRAMAQRLFHATGKLGLEAHVALASNPDAASHAAQAEAGITVITAGEESARLQPLPLEVLAPEPEIAETFQRWGLRTFQDLARLPTVQISERLGQEGVRLQQMARGETVRPLRALKEKLCFKESMELEHSIDSLEPLYFILNRLLDALRERLTARNRATNELRLVLQLDSQFGNGRGEEFVRTLRLPIPIRDPKVLLKLLQLDLETHRPPAPIVGVALTAEPVSPRRIQNGLFVPLAPEPEKLELTLARIGAIVGKENVGSPRLVDTHRPDAFRMERFTLPAVSHHKQSLNPRPTPLAMRLCRPPQPITVEMRQGQPARLLFSGRSEKVVTARGPWIRSGDWWRTDSWSREEWDVEVQSGYRRMLYRIFQDPRRGTWFLDGSYD